MSWQHQPENSEWDQRASNSNQIMAFESGRRKRDGLFFEAKANNKEKAVELLNTFLDDKCKCDGKLQCDFHNEIFKE